MQRLQLRENLSDRCFRRLLRLVSVSFHAYMLMRSYGEFSTCDHLPVNEAEQYVDVMNQWCDTDLSISDYYDAVRTSTDSSILYYNYYKELQEIQKSSRYHLDLSEQLFKELYEEYHKYPLVEVMFFYYSRICRTLQSYMCNHLTYQECMDRIMNLNLFENQRPMDSTMLKKMIETGQQWIKRYGELAQAQLNELEKETK